MCYHGPQGGSGAEGAALLETKHGQEETMRLKVAAMLARCALLAAGLTGCTGAASGGKPTVALLILGTQTPYTPPYVDNLKKKLAEEDVELLVFDARFD